MLTSFLYRVLAGNPGVLNSASSCASSSANSEVEKDKLVRSPFQEAGPRRLEFVAGVL